MRTTYTNGEIDAAVARFERIINGARNSNHASEEALEIADRAVSGTAGNTELVTEMRVWADQLLADGFEIGAATARKAAATIERLSLSTLKPEGEQISGATKSLSQIIDERIAGIELRRPLDDNTKAEITARQIWAYFNGGPDGAKWFDENKSLGGPSHIIALCKAAQTIEREDNSSEQISGDYDHGFGEGYENGYKAALHETANSRAEAIGTARHWIANNMYEGDTNAVAIVNALSDLIQQEGE